MFLMTPHRATYVAMHDQKSNWKVGSFFIFFNYVIGGNIIGFYLIYTCTFLT